MNPWDQVKELLAARLNHEAYENWLAKSAFLRADAEALWVGVPDELTKQWIQQEYGGEVWSGIRALNLPYRHVFFQTTSSQKSVEAETEDLPFAPSVNLNPKFTFGTFVVGSCNQFAHAAAQAVATGPAKAYNPLFLYGGTGLGKTHLMHAIGRSLTDRYASMRVLYTTSERFMNEMINCVKLNRMPSFHRHYRSADVLLIDDIQFLGVGNKDRTQEEFFYTFNELFEHQKQIVISSDAPPKNMPGFVERLRSRFEWGLTVDVRPPDLETKMAILEKKADAEGMRLAEDVRVFLATRPQSSVRELEGALVKLTAYASVTDQPVTVAMAKQVLKDLQWTVERKISIEAVIRGVAEAYNLQPGQLKQKSNERRIAYPRQIAMFIARELTGSSLPEIGRAFGGKHHTTVLHSIQKIEKERQTDPDSNRHIHSLMDSIQSR